MPAYATSPLQGSPALILISVPGMMPDTSKTILLVDNFGKLHLLTRLVSSLAVNPCCHAARSHVVQPWQVFCLQYNGCKG